MAISTEFHKRFVDLADDIDEANKTKRANIIGISNSTYFNAYNYGIVPNVNSLIRIANYFNVSVDFLVGNTDSENFSMAHNPATFSERLNYLREKNGIPTVYALADQLHIHRNIIRQWLNKSYLPELDNLTVIAEFFDVSLDYLLGRTDYER